jgi:hypothetical protein
MGFAPLEEILGPIVLPIRGKDYTLPQLSWEEGIRLHTILAGDDATAYVSDVMRLLLGDVYDQLQADDVPKTIGDRVFFTALADFKTGRETAEEVWANGIPKELTELAAAAMGAAMTRQAVETSTPRPVSGNGTTVKTPRKATRSRGSKS